MPFALTHDDLATIIAYAKQKFADERYPYSPALKPVRDALAKLQPKPEPAPPPKPFVPSTLMQKKRR